MAEFLRRFSNDRYRMRASSAVLCALFVVAQIASFAHDALDAHAVCAEHGELIHVACASDGVDAPVPTRAHAAGPSVRQGASRSTPQHEHCGLATLNRERTLELHVDMSVAVAPTCSTAPKLAPVAEDHSSIPLLLLAPKQSPPL